MANKPLDDDERIEVVRCLEIFQAHPWGKTKAWIVNGAPDKETGIADAKRLTEFNVAFGALIIKLTADSA